MPCEIVAHMHCGQCMDEMPAGESPQSWARRDIGFTESGVQVWCLRHDRNIITIDLSAADASQIAIDTN